jgi:hypothetical protein
VAAGAKARATVTLKKLAGIGPAAWSVGDFHLSCIAHFHFHGCNDLDCPGDLAIGRAFASLRLRVFALKSARMSPGNSKLHPTAPGELTFPAARA